MKKSLCKSLIPPALVKQLPVDRKAVTRKKTPAGSLRPAGTSDDSSVSPRDAGHPEIYIPEVRVEKSPNEQLSAFGALQGKRTKEIPRTTLKKGIRNM